MEHLRQGTVPLEYVNEFAVGRSDELREAVSRMGQIEGGSGQLSFVNGPYGSGKTHFLGMVRGEALLRNFAVTHVVLSTRSCPLDRLQMVYAALMSGLNTPECRHRPAFRSVLGSWLSTIRDELIESGAADKPCKHGLQYYSCGYGCFSELLVSRVSTLAGLHPDFRTVLAAYFRANWSNDGEIIRLCERWLLGEPLPAAARKRVGRAANSHRYPGNISKKSALHAFGDAARIVRSVRYSGLVIMLDEAETMPSVGRSGDISAFVNLLRLMKACLREWQAIYCLYATTPYFEHIFTRTLSQIRPLINNEETADRIEREFQDNRIDLGLPSTDDLLKLADVVYRLYDSASEPGASSRLPTRAWIEERARAILDTMGPDAPIRHFVTRLVGGIDSFHSTPE